MTVLWYTNIQTPYGTHVSSFLKKRIILKKNKNNKFHTIRRIYIHPTTLTDRHTITT